MAERKTEIPREAKILIDIASKYGWDVKYYSLSYIHLKKRFGVWTIELTGHIDQSKKLFRIHEIELYDYYNNSILLKSTGEVFVKHNNHCYLEYKFISSPPTTPVTYYEFPYTIEEIYKEELIDYFRRPNDKLHEELAIVMHNTISKRAVKMIEEIVKSSPPL